MADLTVKRRRPGVAKLRSTREPEAGDDALGHQVNVGKIVFLSSEVGVPYLPWASQCLKLKAPRSSLISLDHSGLCLFHPSKMSSKRTLRRPLAASRKHLDKSSFNFFLHLKSKSILKLTSSSKKCERINRENGVVFTQATRQAPNRASSSPRSEALRRSWRAWHLSISPGVVDPRGGIGPIRVHRCSSVAVIFLSFPPYLPPPRPHYSPSMRRHSETRR
jgi:hypothetical protein